MDETDIRIRSLMQTIFKMDIDESDDVSRQDNVAWDSLKHVELMFSLEDAFDVRFDPSELNSLDSVSSIRDAILEHQNE